MNCLGREMKAARKTQTSSHRRAPIERPTKLTPTPQKTSPRIATLSRLNSWAQMGEHGVEYTKKLSNRCEGYGR